MERSESRYTKPPERLARKGRVLKGNYQSSPVVILVQLLVISNTDYDVWAKQFID